MSSNLNESTTIEFSKEKLAVQSMLSNELSLLSVSLEEVRAVDTQMLVRRLSAFVLTGPTIKVRTNHPATAWQHIKHQYFPSWLLDRYPVKYIEQEFDVREHFPEMTNEHLKMAGSKSGTRHIVARISGPLKFL